MNNFDLGYVKTAAVTPEIKVADCKYNCEKIKKYIDEVSANGAKVVVFPELCITGYTCGDLFFQQTLLDGAMDAVYELAAYTKDKDVFVIVGAPYAYGCAGECEIECKHAAARESLTARLCLMTTLPARVITRTKKEA